MSYLKKIYTSAAAAALALAVFGAQAFAAASSITVKTDRSNISYTYNADENSEAKADAAKLFDNFEGISEEYSAENLTVTSSGTGGVVIEVYLKLETEMTAEECSPLDYYCFKITDADGNTLYDGEESEATDADASAKSISLGTFNAESDVDTQVFTVEYKINEEIKSVLDSELTDNVKVSVASKPVNADAAEYSVSVLAEEYGDELFSEPDTAVLSKVVKPNQAPTDADEEVEKTEEIIENAGVTKVCGEDITAGRYLVSGNGIVVVTDKDGNLKGEITVTDGLIDGIDGVDVCVTTITDGDVVTVYPLEGMEKPSIKFEKTNTSVTSAASDGSGDAAASARQTAASKANPKTGDSKQNAALYIIMALSAIGIGALEMVKRRISSNN